MIWIETRSQEQADDWRSSIRIMANDSSQSFSRSETGKTGANDNLMCWADALEEIRCDPESRLTIAVRHLPKPAAFREACRALRQRINVLQEAGKLPADELFALHRLAAVASVAPHEQLEVTPFSLIEALDLDPVIVGWKALPLLGERDGALMETLWGAPSQHVTGAMLYPDIARAAAKHLADLRGRELVRLKAPIEQHSHGAPLEGRLTTDSVFSRLTGWVGRQSRRVARG